MASGFSAGKSGTAGPGEMGFNSVGLSLSPSLLTGNWTSCAVVTWFRQFHFIRLDRPHVLVFMKDASNGNELPSHVSRLGWIFKHMFPFT